MSKISLNEFETVSDLFLAYYDAKSKAKEAGWIEKNFQKYPKLKDIWKSFDTKIKDMEKKTDSVAKPYLKDKGIDTSNLGK